MELKPKPLTTVLPGEYSEILKVSDSHGRVDYDFSVVLVIDKDKIGKLSPTIHASYAPTRGIRPGDPVTFKVRTFQTAATEATWDFGDGSAHQAVRSNAGTEEHAPDGYAVIVHSFAKPGHYLVSAEQIGADGAKVAGRLHVTVDEPN